MNSNDIYHNIERVRYAQDAWSYVQGLYDGPIAAYKGLCGLYYDGAEKPWETMAEALDLADEKRNKHATKVAGKETRAYILHLAYNEVYKRFGKGSGIKRPQDVLKTK